MREVEFSVPRGYGQEAEVPASSLGPWPECQCGGAGPQAVQLGMAETTSVCVCVLCMGGGLDGKWLQ